MEYLTDMVTKVPEGTSSAKVEALRAAEAVRAAELSKSGHLIRLWRPLHFILHHHLYYPKEARK